MNLNNFKLLHEDKTHYHLQADKGKPFKIEKAKLDKKSHDHIKKMCDGGQMMKDGGTMLSEEDQAKQDKQDYITNKQADNNILKSYDDRSEDDPNAKKKREVREQLLEPGFSKGGEVQRFYEDGTVQPNSQNMTPSSPQTPNQMTNMPLPAQQSTQQESNQAVENNLQENEPGLETPKIAPDDLLLMGGSALLSGAGRAATRAMGQNILGDAGSIGARDLAESAGMGAIKSAAAEAEQKVPEAGKMFISPVKKAIQEQVARLEGLPNEIQQKHLQTAYEAYIDALGHITPDKIKSFASAEPEHLASIAKGFKPTVDLKNLFTNEINRNRTGVLSNLTQDAVKKAKGGEVQRFYEDGTVQPNNPPLESNQSSVPSLSDVFGISSAEARQPGDFSPNKTIPSPTLPTPAAENKISPSVDFIKPLQDQKAAILEGANAIGGEGKEEFKAIKDTFDKINLMNTPQDIILKNMQDNDNLMQSYKDQKVDPNKYWNDRGTPGKILAGIAMALGGGGAGVSGQPNLAAKMIDDSINRDIDSQKNDQSQAMNLWKMNREGVQNDIAANLLTKNQMLTGVKYRLMQAQANWKGPQALAQAHQSMAQIDQAIAQNNYMYSILNPTNQSTGGIDPESEQGYINHTNSMRSVSGMSPLIGNEVKRRDLNYIQGSDTSPGYKTERPPTAAERTQITGQDTLNSLLNQAENFRDKSSGYTGHWLPDEAKGKGEVLNNSIKLAMAPLLLNMRRASPELADKMESMVGDLNGTDFSGQQLGKIRAVKEMVQTFQDQTLKNLRAKQFNPPSNIRILNGTPHQRVPGGWQDIK